MIIKLLVTMLTAAFVFGFVGAYTDSISFAWVAAGSTGIVGGLASGRSTRGKE